MDTLAPLLAEVATFARAHPYLLGALVGYVLLSNVLSAVPPLKTWPIPIGGRTFAFPIGMVVHAGILNVGHIVRKIGEQVGPQFVGKILAVLFPDPPAPPPPAVPASP